MPGGQKITTAAEKIQAMRRMLQQLVEAGTLRLSWSRPLENALDHAARAIAEDDIRTGAKLLDVFRRKVLLLENKGWLPAMAADTLIVPADSLMQELQER